MYYAAIVLEKNVSEMGENSLIHNYLFVQDVFEDQDGRADWPVQPGAAGNHAQDLEADTREAAWQPGSSTWRWWVRIALIMHIHFFMYIQIFNIGKKWYFFILIYSINVSFSNNQSNIHN